VAVALQILVSLYGGISNQSWHSALPAILVDAAFVPLEAANLRMKGSADFFRVAPIGMGQIMSFQGSQDNL
jgi:hypothetical protein